MQSTNEITIDSLANEIISEFHEQSAPYLDAICKSNNNSRIFALFEEDPKKKAELLKEAEEAEKNPVVIPKFNEAEVLKNIIINKCGRKLGIKLTDADLLNKDSKKLYFGFRTAESYPPQYGFDKVAMQADLGIVILNIGAKMINKSPAEIEDMAEKHHMNHRNLIQFILDFLLEAMGKKQPEQRHTNRLNERKQPRRELLVE